MSNNNKQPLLKFTDGSFQFRLRLITSILSQKPILITNIRSSSLTSPGLNSSEASFLHLIDKITNGTTIEINTTGTQLKFLPGMLLGGRFEHDCTVQEEERGMDNSNSIKSIGWYIEGILPLLPFGKTAFEFRFTGVTDGCNASDLSVDYFQYTLPSILNQFGITSEQALYLRIKSRGGYPKGGGVVILSFPLVRHQLQSIDYTKQGKIKRIRGYAISCKMNPTSSARVAHAAKGMCLRLLPDVWIHTDVHSHKHSCGPCPSLNLCLYTQSTEEDVVLCAEASLSHRELPEDLGQRGTALLFHEIQKGGCVDTSMQSLVLLWMCLTSEDVSRVRMGTLSDYCIQSLRLYKLMFGVEFKVTCHEMTKTVLLSCLGTGFHNTARAST